MSAFIIEPDLNYSQLDLQALDFAEYFPETFDLTEIISFSLHNLSLSSFWPSMSTGFYESGDNLPIPDIGVWLDYGLLLSPAAKIYLGERLRPYGEFLPIFVDGEQWHIFNCLAAVDLDSNGSSQSKITFNQSLLGNKLIFKCLNPENFGFYCQDTFKNLIESYKLKGLRISKKRADFFEAFDQTIEVIE